jgi:site-specific recombinase XerD
LPRKPRLSPPAYSLHKASGNAVVRIDGKDHYLGPHGSPESHAKYERLLAEARAARLEGTVTAEERRLLVGFTLTIVDVLSRYKAFCEVYYVNKDGKPSKELADMRYALRPLRLLYGVTLAREFGPLKLKAIQAYMIETQKLSRGVINQRIKRIKRFFKWAVSEELVPSAVTHGLSTVAGLRRGRCNAREAPPVKPVAQEWVDAALPYMSRHAAAMVQVQQLGGMRPYEVVIMRACDIDMSGDVWLYSPQEHKNEWRGHSRTVALGPAAQAVIRPFLTPNLSAYLFSPRAAEAERNEARGVNRNPLRKTKIYPCELRARERRKAKARKRVAKHPKRERYDVDSYRSAIQYAIVRANKQRALENLPEIPMWFPLQLRHSRATEVRRTHGIEAAQVVLGHRHANVTEIYAERNLQLAIQIARKSG